MLDTLFDDGGLNDHTYKTDFSDEDFTTKPKYSVFDYIKDITLNKEGLMVKDENFEKTYSRFTINRGLSNNPQDIFWANLLNQYDRQLTNRTHYDFLFNIIEPSRRYNKWVKPTKTHEDILLIARYYSISPTEAETYLNMMPQEALDALRKKEGGIIKKSKSIK